MASGGARDTTDMERPEEDKMQEPYWKRIKDSFTEKTMNKTVSIYNLPLIKPRDVTSDLFNKLQFGEKKQKTNHKVIMMVGQSGAGKSTLINAMINYILGVEWTDNVRIKLIEEHTTDKTETQTSKVTCYEINHQEGFKISYSLTILDTPGFGHSGGTEEDKQIVKQITECFTSPAGVQHIDTVCFVVRDRDVHLTDSQKYVFDSILWIFGKDIEENIIFCATHCDESEPEVINTVVEASFPCAKDEQDRPVYFCFNNSDIPVHSDNKINRGSSKIREGQWEESMENMEKFFTFLPNLRLNSFILKQDVLQERLYLPDAKEKKENALKESKPSEYEKQGARRKESLTDQVSRYFHKERPEEDKLQEPYWKRIKDSFTEKNIVNKTVSIYNLTLLKPRDARSDLFNKLQFGGKKQKTNHKVILMVGQTGAGKSTLINAMINYILGVEWKDHVRIKLIEEHRSHDQSQTTKVTCYEINHEEGFKIPYSLTILDTPGFGYTGGTEEKQIVKQIKKCFTSRDGVQHIDAVCFVVKASDVRLSESQKYVFDSVLQIFGKDIGENIIFCVTHCDDPKPEVINTLVKASVPCRKDEQDRPVYFCFNNSDIPVHSDNEINRGSSKTREGQWEEAMQNMEKLFTFLPNLNTKSLTLTQEVLMERRVLEIIIEGLIPKIDEQTLKAHELEKIKNTLKKHEAEIEKNKHFEYELKGTLRSKIPTDQNSVNCRECQSTCHHPCNVSVSKLVYLCEAFYLNADCRVCGHGQSKHFCENQTWKTCVATVTITHEELKKKYETVINEKVSVQTICERLSAEIQTSEREALKDIETATKCLQRLQEIALKPDPLTTTDYINLLINDEASNKKPGYIERIKSLEKLREQII